MIDLEALRKVLADAGAKEEKPPPHALLRAKLGSGIATVYKSGVISYAGKDFSLIKSIIDDFQIKTADLTPRIGCDEAGKGERFGPIVLSCVFADGKAVSELLKLGVRDSKKLSDRKIAELSDKILKISHGLVRVIQPKVYNKLYERYKNLNKLMQEQYIDLIKKLLSKYPVRRILVDQFSSRFQEKLSKELPENLEIVVKPRLDERDVVVAAASILAKKARLDALKSLEEKFGVKLPKSNEAATFPKELLPELAKLHFKGGKT